MEPPELEDFEATLGTDRRCRGAEVYSRVSPAGCQSCPPEEPCECPQETTWAPRPQPEPLGVGAGVGEEG